MDNRGQINIKNTFEKQFGGALASPSVLAIQRLTAPPHARTQHMSYDIFSGTVGLYTIPADLFFSQCKKV